MYTQAEIQLAYNYFMTDISLGTLIDPQKNTTLKDNFHLGLDQCLSRCHMLGSNSDQWVQQALDIETMFV